MIQKQLASPETIKQRFGSSWEEVARLVDQHTMAGREILILTAGNMGYPLYQKFGFEHIFNYKVFEARP